MKSNTAIAATASRWSRAGKAMRPRHEVSTGSSSDRITSLNLIVTGRRPRSLLMLSFLRPRDFQRHYAYWLPPALVALVLTLVYLNPFIGDWDGLDYTIFSLHGRPSSMALGRSLFTLTNFVFYKVGHALFGLRPEHAYLL